MYRDIEGFDPRAQEKFNAAMKVRRRRLQERIANSPNQATLGELIFAAGVIVVCSVSLLFFSAVICANIYFWFANKPTWVLVIGLMIGAVTAGLVAWLVRDVGSSRIYPVCEIIFGTVLAAQGPLQAGSNTLAGIVAFVGGVRIITDGFKRFFKHKSYRLFSIVRVRYNWRNFKRWARSWSYHPI